MPRRRSRRCQACRLRTLAGDPHVEGRPDRRTAPGWEGRTPQVRSDNPFDPLGRPGYQVLHDGGHRTYAVECPRDRIRRPSERGDLPAQLLQSFSLLGREKE